MIIQKSSKIKENTRIYIINGRWHAYIIRDSATKELMLYMPSPRYKNGMKKIYHTTKKIDQNTTYEDIFPSNRCDIRVQEIEPLNLKLNNLPSDFVDNII